MTELVLRKFLGATVVLFCDCFPGLRFCVLCQSRLSLLGCSAHGLLWLAVFDLAVATTSTMSSESHECVNRS